MMLSPLARRIAGAALFATVAGSSARAQSMPSICDAITGNLVTNCGFESGTFSGWTQFGNTAFTSVSTVAPNSGTHLLRAGPAGSVGGIKQTVNLTGAGQLSFSLLKAGESSSAVTATFEVRWGGSTLTALVDPAPFGFTQFTFDVVGTGDNELAFGFRNDPNVWSLDDVAVTGTSVPVPEPGALGLLALSGLPLLVRVRRRRA
jgi:hypothetical protein